MLVDSLLCKVYCMNCVDNEFLRLKISRKKPKYTGNSPRHNPSYHLVERTPARRRRFQSKTPEARTTSTTTKKKKVSTFR